MLVLRVVRDASELEKERTETFPALVFPLESSVVTLQLDGEATRVDRSTFAVVPARATYRLSADMNVLHVVTLLVEPDARRAAKREYQPDFVPATFDEIVARPRVLGRTRWVDEIVQRYVFERLVCDKHDSAAARFLETEITKEVFFLGKEQLAERTRASVVRQEGDLATRARAWLDGHLFETVHTSDLATRCRCSESTLLRAFRRAVGVAPTVYVRNRRLEEALLLLESGRYNVSEVATTVGYANVSAFTAAFGRRFGSSPSAVRPRSRATLPPEGERPVRRRRARN